MKITKIFFIIVLIISISACKNEQQYKNAKVIYWDDFGPEKLLKGEELYFNDQLQRPVRILATDSLIYLANIPTEHLLQIMNPIMEQSLGEFISFGSGPGELLNIEKIIKKDSILHLYDFGQSCLKSFSDLGNSSFSFRESTVYEYPFYDLFMTSDTTSVALAMDTRAKRISFFKKNSLIHTTGEYPEINNQDLDPLEKLEGFAGYIIGNTEQDILVLAYKQTDLIEIYDMDGNLKKRLHGPDHFFPLVKSQAVGEDEIRVASTSGESKNAFFYPVADKEFFYVLYSGKIFNKKNVDYLSEWVLLFDWDGNPVARYKLDKPIFAFSVDTRNRIMYGISDRPEFHIVKYQY